jgi:hypothetical protein
MSAPQQAMDMPSHGSFQSFMAVIGPRGQPNSMAKSRSCPGKSAMSA